MGSCGDERFPGGSAPSSNFGSIPFFIKPVNVDCGQRFALDGADGRARGEVAIKCSRKTVHCSSSAAGFFSAGGQGVCTASEGAAWLLPRPRTLALAGSCTTVHCSSSAAGFFSAGGQGVCSASEGASWQLPRPRLLSLAGAGLFSRRCSRAAALPRPLRDRVAAGLGWARLRLPGGGMARKEGNYLLMLACLMA